MKISISVLTVDRMEAQVWKYSLKSSFGNTLNNILCSFAVWDKQYIVSDIGEITLREDEPIVPDVQVLRIVCKSRVDIRMFNCRMIESILF